MSDLMGLRQRIHEHLRVYLVTDERSCNSQNRTVVDTVRQAVEGGVTCVQLRGKSLSARELLAQTVAVAEAVGERVPVLVNDRIDVFLAARASGARVHGIHVGQSDVPPRLARKMIGEEAVLGLSAATPEQLADSGSTWVDYVGIGPVHNTATKADAPAGRGLAWATELRSSAQVPAVAIGGITGADLEELRVGGFAGAAVVSAICAAKDPRQAASALAKSWAAHSLAAHAEPVH